MSEITLLLFGCAISFMTAAGTYLFYRNQFSQLIDDEDRKLKTPLASTT
jgi:hypothetical protein